MFSTLSVPRLKKESMVVSYFESWKAVGSVRELQLKGASQRGLEPLDMEAEDATLLEATTKQRSGGRD
jgi:hypothetical protein